MQDAKEEVRSRLNIEDVIGEYVQLKRAGRNFKGLSPFTQERTPSFFVSPEKHIWHDFSSNKGGDVFSFVMEVEGLDFRGALEHLARKAGIDLSLYQKSDRGIAKKKKRLYEALELATNYYQHSLLKNQHALEYVFKKRGLNKQVVQDFRIGYAPSTGDALSTFLLKKGFTKQELTDAGLTSQRYGGLSDMFRGRMMVPLMDGQGQVLGFTARLLVDNPKAPKYLNTPQTLLYDKGRHVFGLHQAKEAIRQNDYAVIVEGNLDVVSSHQAGVKQVVATAGTALTEHHLKALSRLSAHIRLAFDADKAGLAATERAIPIAQAVGAQLSIISLPDEVKDPDELIQKDVLLWQQAVEAAQPVVDWVLEQYSTRYDLKTANGKRQFSTQAVQVIRALNDPVEREHYLKRVTQYIDTSLTALEAKLSDMSEQKNPRILKQPVKKVEEPIANDAVQQDNLLALALKDIPARALIKKMSLEGMIGEERKKLLQYLQANLLQEIEDPLPIPLQEIETYVKILLLKAEARYESWSADDRLLEATKLVRQVQTEHLNRKKQELITALRQAEDAYDDDKAKRLRIELNNLIKEIAHASKR